jgi:adenylate cyclase
MTTQILAWRSKLPSFFSSLQTLQVNILVAFVTLLMVTALVIIGYTYQRNSGAMLKLSSNLINQVTGTVRERTTNYLTPAALIARVSAKIPNLEGDSLVEDANLERYAITVLDLYPQLAGFFMGNEQGDFLFTKRFADGSIGTQIIDRSTNPSVRTWTYRDLDGKITEVETTEKPEYDPRQRPWYEGAKDSQALYWTDIYIFFTDKKPGITASYPILDEKGALMGVIGIDIALDKLSEFLQTQSVGENGLVFIINDKAEVVAHPETSLAMQEGEKLRPLRVSELEVPWVVRAYEQYEALGEGEFTFSTGDTRYMASFTPLPDSFGKAWQISIVVPEDDFIGTIKQTNQISLLISLIVLLVAMISSVFISRSISRPVALLTAETKKIKDFQLDGYVEISSTIREVQHLSEAISAMRTGLRAFQKYVPAELVRQLIKTGEDAKVGGYKRELTILFTDIADFTPRAEKMKPEELMRQLSEYMGELATIIMEQQGTVDKYLGDGLMAFWGAPLPMPDHAYYACRAALLCSAKVNHLNQQWLATGKIPFPTRIGIHTGETLVGNVGSAERLNYTVLGDSVNLASRLEGVNKKYGTEIIVSHATYQKVVDRFEFRYLGDVSLKGKSQKVRVYELIGENILADKFNVV